MRLVRWDASKMCQDIGTQCCPSRTGPGSKAEEQEGWQDDKGVMVVV